MVTDVVSIAEVWKQHFTDLYQGDNHNTSEDSLIPFEKELNILKSEVKKALNTLKNQKVLSGDGIIAIGNNGVEIIHALCHKRIGLSGRYATTLYNHSEELFKTEDIHQSEKQVEEVPFDYTDDNDVSRKEVTVWCRKFEDGQTELNDDPERKRGRLSTLHTDDNCTIAKRFIGEDGIHRSICDLNFRKARWVLKMLSDEQKSNRMGVALQNLTRYQQEGNSFIQIIITGDETWVYEFILETKQ
ncbi:hypothetical protein ILUMI_25446 [Ignelater luminosus]|uniref:Uncharacterized protein n=1 Tax=Ignelater luminosus TaxID=2038154 RepID=A0A8K0C8I4_IGNLU|nr:hypothetical protein ILUMI_25446 [Ignelater luminosus]